MFIDIPWFWLTEWGSEPVSRKITELTGVSFNIIRADNAEQIAMLINSNDLPDLIYCENRGRQTMLSDPDVCYSYNELVECSCAVKKQATKNKR